MTNTPVHVNLSCGTGSLVSTDGLPNFSPQRIQLEASTTIAYLILRVSLGGMLDQDRTNAVRACFAPSAAAYNDASEGSYANKLNSRYVEIPIRPALRTLKLERKSDLEMCTGLGYCFIWLEIPMMSNVMTINTNLIQLP